MHKPKPKHVAMLRQLLLYAYTTKSRKLVYEQNPKLYGLLDGISKSDAAMAFLSGSDGQNVQRAVGFVDANYANISDLERKSNTGYIFYLYGCPICWKSKLQPITATSTHEAELIACATASAEALWIRKLLIDLGFAVGLRPAVIEPKGRMKEALQLDGQSILLATSLVI